MSNPDVIALQLQYFHRDGCEKRSPHMIRAPRPSWPADSAPIWRPRVEGDRPQVCTCGLEDALALLTAARPEKEQDQKSTEVIRDGEA